MPRLGPDPGSGPGRGHGAVLGLGLDGAMAPVGQDRWSVVGRWYGGYSTCKVVVGGAHVMYVMWHILVHVGGFRSGRRSWNLSVPARATFFTPSTVHVAWAIFADALLSLYCLCDTCLLAERYMYMRARNHLLVLADVK